MRREPDADGDRCGTLWLKLGIAEQTLVAVASVRKTLNKQPSVRTDELWLSDSNLMKSRVAYFFPASLAMSLQRRVSNGQIDLEEIYASIKRNLVLKTIPKK
jgi:hypothetical protein